MGDYNIGKIRGGNRIEKSVFSGKIPDKASLKTLIKLADALEVGLGELDGRS
ncbi:MAG: hypothetical protein WC628_07920 [Candidatus Omnitrophota bacterium]